MNIKTKGLLHYNPTLWILLSVLKEEAEITFLKGGVSISTSGSVLYRKLTEIRIISEEISQVDWKWGMGT